MLRSGELDEGGCGAYSNEGYENNNADDHECPLRRPPQRRANSAMAARTTEACVVTRDKLSAGETELRCITGRRDCTSAMKRDARQDLARSVASSGRAEKRSSRQRTAEASMSPPPGRYQNQKPRPRRCLATMRPRSTQSPSVMRSLNSKPSRPLATWVSTPLQPRLGYSISRLPPCTTVMRIVQVDCTPPWPT